MRSAIQSQVPRPFAASLPETMMHLSLRVRLRGSNLESAAGLSGRELDLVALLSASGPTSVKSLVADLDFPRSTMTAIVDRLEARGLVWRRPNPADRRSVILEATPAADDALRQYRAAIMQLVDHIQEVLDDDEIGAFSDSIAKLARTL